MSKHVATVAEVFRSENLLVRGATGFSGEVCFVTFDAFTDYHTLDREGFGQRFFQQNGIDAFHIISRNNEWFQLEELPEACRLTACSASRYRRVFSYGSSMGGYGAIRFGRWAGAQRAFALSPQFSIDSRKAPFEKRWRHQARRTRFIHEGGEKAVAQAIIVYDPLSVDARHADLFRQITEVIDVRLPHCGHPSGPYLAELGLLSSALTALAGDALDAMALQREARRRRREAAQFYINLALRARSPRIKAELGARAVQLAPGNAETRAHYAVFAAAAGRRHEALAAMDMAEVLEPGRPHMKVQRSLVYELLGDLSAAVDVMEALMARGPTLRSHGARLRHLKARQLVARLRKRMPRLG